MRFRIFFILLASFFVISCSKKRFEDTDAYKKMIENQKEIDKKLDSIRQENYKQLLDTTNSGLRRTLDSLKRRTDSLQQQLDKSIKELKKSK
jgi:septal ring factor EnvC (AmiA/AmiB activator)